MEKQTQAEKFLDIINQNSFDLNNIEHFKGQNGDLLFSDGSLLIHSAESAPQHIKNPNVESFCFIERNKEIVASFSVMLGSNGEHQIAHCILKNNGIIEICHDGAALTHFSSKEKSKEFCEGFSLEYDLIVKKLSQHKTSDSKIPKHAVKTRLLEMFRFSFTH